MYSRTTNQYSTPPVVSILSNKDKANNGLNVALNIPYKHNSSFSKSQNSLVPNKPSTRSTHHTQRDSISSNNLEPSLNNYKKSTRNRSDTSQTAINKQPNQLSLKPVRMPPTVGLSPLDALRVKAEAELKKRPNLNILLPGTTNSKQNILNNNSNNNIYKEGGGGKLDMSWTKELEFITKDFKQLETSIGVDKRKSIAHFRNSVSPIQDNYNSQYCELSAVQSNKLISPKPNVVKINSQRQQPNNNNNNNLSRHNQQLKHAPTPRNSVLPTQQIKNLNNNNSFTLEQNNNNNTHSAPQQTTNSSSNSSSLGLNNNNNSLQNYYSPMTTSSDTSSSTNSLPNTPQTPTKLVSPDLPASPDTLSKELAWERRQRFLLEVRLSEEKERNRALEKEVLALRSKLMRNPTARRN